MNIRDIFKKSPIGITDGQLLRIFRHDCPDLEFAYIDKKTNFIIEALTSELVNFLPDTVDCPTPIFIKSIVCDTSIHKRSGKNYILLNINDGQLLDFIYDIKAQRQFVVGCLHWLKQSIAENYIYTNELNLFAVALAYENIPPFLFSNTYYSGSQEQFSEIVTGYFNGIKKSDISTISICFDLLHEWGHFLLKRTPEKMIEFETLAEEHFMRSITAFPSYQQVESELQRTGWEVEYNPELYKEIVENKKQSSLSLFPTIKDEVTCDVFALSMLVKANKTLNVSYWKLLKIVHAKVQSHHLRIVVKQLAEQLNVYGSLKFKTPLDDSKLEIFSGQVSDRANVSGDFLLSFVMDSTDKELKYLGSRHIDEMRAFNQVILEAFLFPSLKIIPLFIKFSVEKLHNDSYKDSIAYFIDNLSLDDIALFVKNPSFI